MAYSVITDMRIPYDIDGTQVGSRTTDGVSHSVLITQGVSTWFTPEQAANFNKQNPVLSLGGYGANIGVGVWFVFPEQRDISALWLRHLIGDGGYVLYKVQCSTDTTNGLDGSWMDVTATLPTLAASHAADSWRRDIVALTGVTGITGLRLAIFSESSCRSAGITNIHLYGKKTSGQTANDLLMTNAAGNEITALKDIGTIGVGGNTKETIYIKNVSTVTANAITVDVEGYGYTTSLDNITFNTTQKSLGNLAAGSISAPVYVKFAPIAGATLGPSDGRIVTNLAYFG
jgi:hypothetical protein